MLLDKLVKTTAAAKAEALGNSRRSRLLLVTSTIVLPVLISVVTSREDDFASNGMFWAVVIVLALLQVGLFAIQIAGPQTSQEAYFEGLALAQEVQALSAEKGVLEREVNYQMLLSRSVQTWRAMVRRYLDVGIPDQKTFVDVAAKVLDLVVVEGERFLVSARANGGTSPYICMTGDTTPCFPFGERRPKVIRAKVSEGSGSLVRDT